MKVKCAFILTLISLSISCGIHSECSGENANQEIIVQQTQGISSETAVAIAKGYLCFDYDLRGFDIDVLEHENDFEVHFKQRVGENVGTGPVVIVKKADGSRLYTVHSK